MAVKPQPTNEEIATAIGSALVAEVTWIFFTANAAEKLQQKLGECFGTPTVTLRKRDWLTLVYLSRRVARGLFKDPKVETAQKLAEKRAANEDAAAAKNPVQIKIGGSVTNSGNRGTVGFGRG